VQILLPQQDNAPKLLTIINARNRVPIDRKLLFDINPALASTWFAFYACSYYSSLVSETGWDNLRQHFAFVDRRLRIQHQIQETYFGSTYAGGDRDRMMKPIVNQTVREHLSGFIIRRGKTDPRKIAFASLFWSPGTSVYRILSPMVKSLKPDFHLTYIQMNDSPPPDNAVSNDEVTRISYAVCERFLSAGLVELRLQSRRGWGASTPNDRFDTHSVAW
jgi:hypothetical protein